MKGRIFITSMLVFRVKPDGLFMSRFCAQGFSQVAVTDFGGTYAPVWRIPCVRVEFAFAASHDRKVIQLDVQTTFPQSEMKEEVYVKKPVGFEKKDLNGQPYVCNLKISLYGLKQSPWNCNATIQHELISERCKACVCDPCVYIKDENSSEVLIVLYVGKHTHYRILRGRYFEDRGFPDDQIRNQRHGRCFFVFRNAEVP